MENLQSNLATLGTATVQALTKEPYQMQDYDAAKTTNEGVGMSTSVESSQPSEPSLAEQRSEEIIRGVQNLEGMRGLYEPPEGISEFDTETLPPRMPTDFNDGESDLPPANRDVGQVKTDFMERVKVNENASQEGLRNGRFYPINSTEGKGDLNPTGQEIGYGMVIKPEWLGNDRSKWPVINGTPVDVKRGLTPEQMDTFLSDKVDEVSGEMAKIVPKWDELAPQVQMYFVDFGFNTGASALKAKNPTAFKALEEGQPLDAMVATFNYWNITKGGQKTASRGLLNRRLNEYNEAARGLGIPEVESYQWGGGRAKIKFSGKLKDGTAKYQNKDSIMLRSSNIKEGSVTEHTQTEGRF